MPYRLRQGRCTPGAAGLDKRSGFHNNQIMSGLTDTHAHLSLLADSGPEPRGIPDWMSGGAFDFVLDVGLGSSDIEKRTELLRGYKNVRLAAGVWPSRKAIAERVKEIERLEAALGAPGGESICAVGECGYDRRENPGLPTEEEELFVMQLECAVKYKKPVIVHSREEPERTLGTLKKFRGARGIIHCFSYTKDEAKKFLDSGFYISFAGNLTFKNAAALREALKVIPEDRLLLETDAPFLAPVPYRGKPCRPGMIIETYRTAAMLRGTGVEELKAAVAANIAALCACRT